MQVFAVCSCILNQSQQTSSTNSQLKKKDFNCLHPRSSLEKKKSRLAQIVCDFFSLFCFVFIFVFVFVFVFFHFLFGKKYKSILHLNWVSLRVFLSFQVGQGTNLQEIEMSMTNFAEIKNGIIFYKKV